MVVAICASATGRPGSAGRLEDGDSFFLWDPTRSTLLAGVCEVGALEAVLNAPRATITATAKRATTATASMYRHQRRRPGRALVVLTAKGGSSAVLLDGGNHAPGGARVSEPRLKAG